MISKFSEVAELAKRKTTQDLTDLANLESALYLQNVLLGIAEVLNHFGLKSGYSAEVSRSNAKPGERGSPPEIVKDILCVRAHRPVRHARGYLGTDIVRLSIRHNGIEDCTGPSSTPIVKLNEGKELTGPELDAVFAVVRKRFLEVRMGEGFSAKGDVPEPA